MSLLAVVTLIGVVVATPFVATMAVMETAFWWQNRAWSRAREDDDQGPA